MRARNHLIGSIALAAGIAASAGTAVASTPQAVVLGNAKSTPQATGWGTPAPRLISSGTESGSRISQIHWQRWGSATATGWGETSIPRLIGGYYPGLYRVQLRATGIAWDKSEHAHAYMHLEAREPLQPGGELSPWFQWVGQQEMCS